MTPVGPGVPGSPSRPYRCTMKKKITRLGNFMARQFHSSLTLYRKLRNKSHVTVSFKQFFYKLNLHTIGVIDFHTKHIFLFTKTNMTF